MATDAWLRRAFRVILVYLVGNWLVPGKLSQHNSPRHRHRRYYDILRHSTRQCDNQLLQGVAMSTLPHFGLQMLPWYILGLMEFLGNDSKCNVWLWNFNSKIQRFRFRIVAILMCTSWRGHISNIASPYLNFSELWCPHYFVSYYVV